MKNKKKGFTLVELVIVIAVIAILAAVLIPTFSSVIKNANNSADLQLVNNLNIVASTHSISDTNNEFETADNIRLMLKEEGINPDSLTTKNKDAIIVYNTSSGKFERCTLKENALEAFAAEAEDFYVGYYLEEIFENRIILSTRGNDLAEAIFALHNLPGDVDAGYIDKQLKKIPSELQEKVKFIMESSVFINEEGKVVTFNGSIEPTTSNEISEDKTRIIFYEQEQNFDLSNLTCSKTSLHAIIPNYVTINGNHNASMHFAGNTGALEENGATVEKVAVARDHAKKCDNKRSTILSIAGDLELNLYDFYSNGTLEELSWNNFQNKFGDKFTGAINEKGEEVESITLNSMTDGTNSYSSETVTSVYGGTYQINATVDGIVLNKLIKFKTVQIGSKIDYNGSATWYTIEDALATTDAGATVVVGANTCFTALKSIYDGNEYYTVKSGVTLLVPYDGISGEIDETNHEHLFNKAKNCNIELYVGKNIKIINNGTIKVGGKTSGGGGGRAYAGYTISGYAQITLGANATIESNGNISAYGVIKEESENNGSKVIMTTGTLTMPFVVVEHRGGTAFGNMIGGIAGAKNPAINLKTSPFNRFFMENVTPEFTIESEANLVGRANLYANDAPNTTDINLVGSSSENLIQLDDNSKVVSKYNVSSQVTQLDIYGSVTINSLSLFIKDVPMLGDVELSTSYVMFPISYYWDITLMPFADGSVATVDSTKQDIKILPGATLTIEKDVTVNVNKLAVYDSNDALASAVADFSYNVSTPGRLIVNGTLNVNTIAGHVQTTEDVAMLQITGGISVDIKEVNKAGGATGLFMGDQTKYNEKTYKLMLKMHQDGVLAAEPTEQTVGSYMSYQGGWQNVA